MLKRETLLKDAVEWCRQNGKRGVAALSTGMFPLIKSKNVINARLDGNVATVKEKKHLRILTAEEENNIVYYLKCKNRAHQGLSRGKVTNLIMDVLQIRQTANKKMKGGRKYIALSKNANRALHNKW